MREYMGGGGGSRKLSISRGDHFNEIAFKGGIGKMSLCLAQNPPTHQAINNDRSLSRSNSREKNSYFFVYL